MKAEIYVYQWDQGESKIVQFFKVVKKTDKSVTLRELRKEKIKDLKEEPRFLNYTVKPTDRFVKPPFGVSKIGKEFRKKVNEDGTITMDNGIAELWNGRAVKTKIRRR